MRLAHTRLLLVLLLVLLGAGEIIPAGRVPRGKVYRSQRLGIEFQIPSNWIYKKCDKSLGLEDCVGFSASRRRQRGSSEDYIATVAVRKMDLEKALGQEVLFEKVNGEWVKHGRFETVKSQKISGSNWQGVYAVADCGISDENGFHAAGGQCLTAVLSNGSRSATIETDGVVSPELVLKQVVRSFKFIG